MATLLPRSDAHKTFEPPLLPPPLAHALLVGTRKPATDCRADLAPGRYDIDAAVSIRGLLSVGEDSLAASAIVPQADQLLAVLLAKLNSATRDKLLRELPDEFVRAGNQMPETELSRVDDARELLSRLRRSVTRTRRGAVTGTFDMTVIPALVLSKLSVAG